MSHLQPVPNDYQPRYPRELSEQQIRDLLRPSLLARFSNEVFLTGALVAGITATGCAPAAKVHAAPANNNAAKAPNTISKDPMLKAQVDKLLQEVLGKYKTRGWNASTSIRLKRTLKTNPPIKYPHIPISFGNSYVGIFDTKAAKEVTARLFNLYGIEVEADVKLDGNGYEFIADGYNAKKKVGFEIIVPEGRIGFGRQVIEPEKDEAKLDENELAKLDAVVERGGMKMFIVHARGFPNMDGDLYTPMEYYLASVIDYLNWINGDKQIDPKTVLGKLPGADRKKKALKEAMEQNGPETN